MNFFKAPADEIDSLGTKYDYRSMMHYGKTAFGGGKTTIETKDKKMADVIGQRDGFRLVFLVFFVPYIRCVPKEA